jgi:hypothetical protein
VKRLRGSERFQKIEGSFESPHEKTCEPSLKQGSIMPRAIFFFIVLLLPATAVADTIYLKTGKTIDTSMTWEEEDKIYFYLNGLKVSVPKSDVRYIESSRDNSSVEGVNEEKIDGRPGPGEDSGEGENKTRTSDRFDDKWVLEKELGVEEKNDGDAAQGPEDRPARIVELGEDGEFRGLKWGERLSRIKGMVLVDTDTGLPDVHEYLRLGESLTIGDVDLRYIVYAFWHDMLYTITLWTSGQSNYEKLRELVSKLYGKGLQVDPDMERYIWYGGSTDMMLEFLEKGEHGMFWTRSRKVHSQFKLSGYRQAVTYSHWLRERVKNKEKNEVGGYDPPPE